MQYHSTRLPGLCHTVKLSEAGSLPESQGVYQVWDKEGNVLYIGSSKNLRKRWISHHVMMRLVPYGLETLRIAWSFHDDYRAVEARWIRFMKPALNRSGVGKIKD